MNIEKIEQILNHLIKTNTNIYPRVLNSYLDSNKGKFGLWIEQILGCSYNNKSVADIIGLCELKTVSVFKDKKTNSYKVKETVAIGMHQKKILPSKFINKNKTTLFIYLDKTEEKLQNVNIVGFKMINLMKNQQLLKLLLNDIKLIINADVVSSSIGDLIQSRTKGSANSKSRALYYKKKYLELIINNSNLV